MQIHPLSDLHLEVAPYRADEKLPLEVDAQIIVLAGDIANGAEGVRWAKQAFAGKIVVYVPGNHEYFLDKPMDAILEDIRNEAQNSNVVVLDRDEVIVQNVRFLGATLWSDFQVEGDAWQKRAMDHARTHVEDFSIIRQSATLFMTPELMAMLHERDKRWLAFKLQEPFAGETVVVTHYGCTTRSIAPQWTGNLLNGAFVSSLPHLLGRCALWIHGHTHHPFDYEEEGTRVLVNPRGTRGLDDSSARSLGPANKERIHPAQFDAALVVSLPPPPPQIDLR
ncbi:MAG: metallophosphoesterase family protein [Agitococcus sp.]|nr:metallophosphoesterase family protein [Agitococcus sp.]MDO9179177.1 metallophosphoesterase family protein [Agitococcus sp.]